jgi:hypothetical protein
VPGLEKRERDHLSDDYCGTGEAFAASGLLPFELLPGQPGRPKSNASYRPLGSEKADLSWWVVPGFIQVARRADGTYRARLAVSHEERARRTAKRERAKAEHDELLRRSRQKFSDEEALLLASLRLVPIIDTPATLHIGDSVVTSDGDAAVIIRAYAHHKVSGAGEREGYVARLEHTGEEYFYPACDLWDRVDERPRYLRLVETQPAEAHHG